MADYPWTDGDCLTAASLNAISEVITLDAGENITSGDAVYIHLTAGTVFRGDNATQNDRRFDGFALTGATTGNSLSVQTKGVWITSGLTAGTTYYLANSGEITDTFSPVRVGIGLSTTELWLNSFDDRHAAVGTVVDRHLDLTGVPALTAYWALMDGSTISDTESPLNGQTLTDMNGSASIVVAGDTSGTTGGAATHTHTAATTYNDTEWSGPDSTQASVLTLNTASSYPPYLTMVKCIKVK